MKKRLMMVVIILTILFIGPLIVILKGEVSFKDDYRTASRESANIAPDPKINKEAVIQVYAARAFNWRGAFASHSWIATKNKDADEYVVYQVLGWRSYQNLPIVAIEKDIPDRSWFNQKPRIILDIRGEKAEDLIVQIASAAENYPYLKYTLWPGPNSNSFVAHIGRLVPNLGLVMPANAIGKDFLGSGKFFAAAPSGTGYQFSLFGIFGITIAKKEGIEINVLSLVYGIKFKPFGLSFPGFF
ncbi:MAG: hypothetical protein ACJAZX_001567 [Rickettsiales bacterium]|jgi:uncharacterized protein YxeA